MRTNLRRSGANLISLQTRNWRPRKSVPEEQVKATKALRAAVLRRAVSLAAPVAGSIASAIADPTQTYGLEARFDIAQRQVP
jgi:hypothetical protein